jgi:hypothetical protein
MTEAADLSAWMERVNRCKNRTEVFALLDDFRKQSWTDEECSQMAKHYIRIVSAMPDDTSSADKAKATAGADQGKEADGPVWYEKM